MHNLCTLFMISLYNYVSFNIVLLSVHFIAASGSLDIITVQRGLWSWSCLLFAGAQWLWSCLLFADVQWSWSVVR